MGGFGGFGGFGNMGGFSGKQDGANKKTSFKFSWLLNLLICFQSFFHEG